MSRSRTKEENSRLMRRVKNSGSAIEKALQKELWNRGIRYRKNDKTVIGKPDICLKGLKIAVFCDSEFWHGFNWAERKKDFKTNTEFWIPKIERNIARDTEVTALLEADGWIVLRYWGNEIKQNTKTVADEIEKYYYERKRHNGKI